MSKVHRFGCDCYQCQRIEMAKSFMNDPSPPTVTEQGGDGGAEKLLAVCVEIREAFSYFSEWDLPIGFEGRLNEALKPYGEMVNGEWVAKESQK